MAQADREKENDRVEKKSDKGSGEKKDRGNEEVEAI